MESALTGTMLTKVPGPTVRKHFLTVGPVTFVSIAGAVCASAGEAR